MRSEVCTPLDLIIILLLTTNNTEQSYVISELCLLLSHYLAYVSKVKTLLRPLALRLLISSKTVMRKGFTFVLNPYYLRLLFLETRNNLENCLVISSYISKDILLWSHSRQKGCLKPLYKNFTWLKKSFLVYPYILTWGTTLNILSKHETQYWLLSNIQHIGSIFQPLL